MPVTSPIIDSTPPEGSFAAGAAPSGHRDPELRLIEETRQQIQTLAAEVAELSQANVPPADFCAGFLSRVVAALGAVGGALWAVGDGGRLELEYQTNLDAAQLDEPTRRSRHQLLLERAVRSRQAVLAPPRSGAGEEVAAGNPTEYLLVLAPIICDDAVSGVVEVVQRPGGGPATQRGYLRFLTQMADLAAGYQQGRKLRSLGQGQEHWRRLEQFIVAVHSGLDPQRTAYTIANEGRRLLECDRLSVLLARRGKLQTTAVSGLDKIDHRAATVRTMTRLADIVSAGGEPLCYEGDARDVPPQIEAALDRFIDQSHARAVAVTPLWTPDLKTDSQPAKKQLLGALVVEQLRGGEDDAEDDVPASHGPSLEAAARHSAAALANAAAHHGVFLMPVWKALGKLRRQVGGAWLKTLCIAAAVTAVVAGLILTPARFELEGRGALQPVVRRQVFAGLDGAVAEVLVAHGQEVQQGQLLARLRSSTDLEVAIADLVGRRLATGERIAAVQRALLGRRQLTPDDQDRLSGQLLELRRTADSIESQLRLYDEQKQRQQIVSPLDGQVATWNVRDLLIQRPVRKGQALMTVVDPQGDWQLEIEMPLARMGHVARAAQRSQQPLDAVFMLATHPGEEFPAAVTEIERIAEDRGEEGAVVLVRAAVDRDRLPDLRPGATVTARIDCGSRSVGYVWFHDVIEFVQTQILFRL